jgi:uncharacterized protein DUF1097
MNASTARALFVGLLVAVWVWLTGQARLRLEVWPGIVALGCYFAAGGGVSGLQKTVIGTLSGVAWVLVADAVRVAVGGTSIVGALIAGAMAVGIILVSRVPFLGFVAGAFAGAGVAWGLRVNTVQEGIQAAISLVVGALLGFVAERLAGAVAKGRA